MSKSKSTNKYATIRPSTISKYAELLSYLSSRKRIGSIVPVLAEHKICRGAHLTMSEMGLLTKTAVGYEWTGPQVPSDTDAKNVIWHLNRRIRVQAEAARAAEANTNKVSMKNTQTFASETKIPTKFAAHLERDREQLKKRIKAIDDALAALRTLARL